MTLTHGLREELARGPMPERPAVARAELEACLRFAGDWTRRGDGGPGWVVSSPVAEVIRRVRSLLAARGGQRAELSVLRPGELSRAARFRLRVEGAEALVELGLVDASGAPRPAPATELRVAADERLGYVRGALMAAGHLAGPGQAPHLEVRARGAAAAADLAGLLSEDCDVPVSQGPHAGEWRVAAKSGAAIGALLAQVGAHRTFLEFDRGRLERQLRGDANRARNADHANVARAVEASARQVRRIEGLLAGPEGEALSEELRAAALARLANPGASLAELARLLDVGRATVHRRLRRLEDLADRQGIG